VAIACAAVFLIWTISRGLVPDSPVRHLDGQAMFIAAKCLQQGASPYDQQCFSTAWLDHFGTEKWDSMFFPYPVTMFAVVYPLALFEWSTARHLIDAANLVSIALILLGLVLWIRSRAPDPDRRLAHIALGLILAAMCGSISGVILLGQTSLVALAGLAWMILSAGASSRSSAVLFAVALLAASTKPHMTLVPACAILLFASRKQVAAGIVTVAAVALATVAATGWQVIPEFFEMLGTYRSVGANQGPNLAGASLLASYFGASLSARLALLLSFASAALFAHARRREWAAAHETLSGRALDSATIVGIVLCASFWLPLHSYDLVIYLVPLAFVSLLGPAAFCVLVPGLLLVARPNAAAALVGGNHAALVQSAAMLYVAIGAFIALKAPRPARAVAEAAPS
jgi:hypothetical protein